MLPSGFAKTLVLLAALLAGSAGIDLGKPTGAVPQYLPLGNFHRQGTLLRSHLRAEVLMFGVRSGPETDAETWPVVKALAQFGTFSGLQPMVGKCFTARFCSPPFLDLVHARYRSRYAGLVYREIVNTESGKCTSPAQLSRAETAILGRNGITWVINCWRFSRGDTVLLPLLDVGGYVQEGIELVNVGDFQTISGGGSGPSGAVTPPVYRALTAETILDRLHAGTDEPQSTLVRDVNTETNVLIALVCHADGMQPGSVCHRPAIRSIEQHVR